jgi:hypothetical protein
MEADEVVEMVATMAMEDTEVEDMEDGPALEAHPATDEGASSSSPGTGTGFATSFFEVSAPASSPTFYRHLLPSTYF